MPSRTLGQPWLPLDLVIPAVTPIANPAVAVFAPGLATLIEVELLIPPGPSGQAGWALEYAGQRILPFDPDGWIIGDGAKDRYGIDLEVSGPITVKGYNLGVYTHTFYARLHLDLFPQGTGVAGGGTGLVVI